MPEDPTRRFGPTAVLGAVIVHYYFVYLIGASILYFHNRFPDATIIGFEPHPETFEILKKNVAGLDSVKIFNCGLGAANRRVTVPGESINYGAFINTVIDFLIVAFVVFLLVRAVSKLMPKHDAPAATKECPRCCETINVKATRCPKCTSDLGAPQAA